MILIKRVPEPTILKKNAKKWEKELVAAKVKLIAISDTKSAKYQEAKKEYSTIEGKYNQKEIKDLLKGELMFNGKCAYCESHILHIDYGHIEHFYPKSKYPERTFRWENLLLACGICNGVNQKGNNFPVNNSNEPLLINPCEDNPNDYFTFDYDETTLLAGVYGKEERGKTTEILLKLNRPELIRHRSDFVKKLVVLAKLSDKNQQAKILFEEACEEKSEYSAFAKMLKVSLKI
jgi:uncharacterized protein (TIGR02646 family)